MKLACSSAAFDQTISRGDMTQIEWLESCATELAADGIVLDERHFPRTDSDYLAQIKKMATDLGLTVAAFAVAHFFACDEDAMERHIGQAAALGAPLLTAPLQRETETSWNEALARIGSATSLAKRFNITLAIRNAPQTFAAGSYDLKRLSKAADSAWLRYAPEFSALDAASEHAVLIDKAVLLWQPLEADTNRLAPFLPRFRGFVALDDAFGASTLADMKNALQSFRNAFSYSAADRT